MAEASRLAERIAAGCTIRQSTEAVPSHRQHEVAKLLLDVSNTAGREGLVAALAAMSAQGAQAVRAEPLWTLPGDLALSGRRTASWATHVDNAETRVVCATYNLQKTSSLWDSLQKAAGRLGERLTLYVDSQAAETGGVPVSELRNRLSPALVWSTKELSASTRSRQRYYRSHAKFLAVDRSFIVVTSANFSHSAEHNNVELGVLVRDAELASAVEEQLAAVQGIVYETKRIA